MKKLISIILALALFSVSSFASAAGLWGDISGLIGEAVDAVSEKVDDALEEVSELAGEAVGFIEDNADEALNWINNKAGEVMDWTSEKAADAWDWASVIAAESWAWTKDKTSEVKNSLIEWININGEDAMDELYVVWNMLLSEAGIAGERIAELWNKLIEYAEEHNIQPLVIVKLAVAVVTRAFLGERLAGEAAGDYIESTLTKWLESYEITTEERAMTALEYLEESANEFFSVPD